MAWNAHFQSFFFFLFLKLSKNFILRTIRENLMQVIKCETPTPGNYGSLFLLQSPKRNSHTKCSAQWSLNTLLSKTRALFTVFRLPFWILFWNANLPQTIIDIVALSCTVVLKFSKQQQQQSGRPNSPPARENLDWPHPLSNKSTSCYPGSVSLSPDKEPWISTYLHISSCVLGLLRELFTAWLCRAEAEGSAVSSPEPCYQQFSVYLERRPTEDSFSQSSKPANPSQPWW